MEEDTEYLKLSVEDRCLHKLWKARVSGYEESTKSFAQQTDDKSPEFSKFAPLMKKFATDANAVALDKALDAVLAFAENAHLSIAGRTAADVTAGIVGKCLAAPKTTTKEKALDAILMYCEIEKYEAVQEELIKGFNHKNPKVVCGCVKAISTALHEFGSKVIAIKLLVKPMAALLDNRDKNVREEAKKMVIEMYRWAGQALKPQLTSLKPIQVQELEAEFEKLPNEKPVPSRYLRSQQELKAKVISNGDEEEGDDNEDEGDGAAEMDPMDLMSPVNILEQLPKDFYEQVECKKWQERKKAMETLLPLSQSAKLEPGDYADLIKALKKIIGKDSNVMIIALAGQCLSGIAKGLKKKFSIYALSSLETILEKFKEKKINVVTALRDAADSVYQSSSIEAIQEMSCAALNNKNPNVKAETASFLARSFAYCTPTMLPKKLLKLYITELLKTLNESDPTVRDNSAEALGTALKVVSEKVMDPFLVDIDPLKSQKIKEYAEKAQIKVKFKAPKSKPASVKSAAPSRDASKSAPKARITKPSADPPAKRPVSAAPAGPPKRAGAKGVRGGGGGTKGSADECKEEELCLEEALEKAKEVLSEENITGLSDTNWKIRLSAVEDMKQAIETADNIPIQALVRVLSNKPGFKDNNFQVIKAKLDVLKYLAENPNFTRRSAEVCLGDLVDKLADPKNGTFVTEALTSIADAAKLQFVGVQVMNLANAQKNPKIQEVAVKWLGDAIKEFGFVLQPKSLITNIKAALAHSNPGVRTAAICLCGTIYIYMGPTLRVFLEDEKPALLQQIDAQFEKVKDSSPPTPTRGKIKASSDEAEAEDGACEPQGAMDLQDILPRVNISDQITSNLILELADKNWKVRIEALSKVASIINESKFITSDLGELPTAICSRLNDKNKNIAAEALRITSSLASALGTHCKPHTRVIVPGIFAAFGDSKQNVRQQALVALNNWVDHLGSAKDVIDGDMCIDALKSGSPFLKAELIGWISNKLKDAQPKTMNKDELNGCIGYLYTGIEDRNADVRKASNDAIYPFMLHLGYDAMFRHTSKVKPSSKSNIVQVLDKVKPMMPVRAAPPAKGKPAGIQKPSSGVSKILAPPRKGTVRSHSASKAIPQKKEEDVDTSPLLQMNNLKNQRSLDEQRLRSLKWDLNLSPRPELITQLKDQMSTANVNRGLTSNMFHQDFKYHIKAIDALAEDLNNNIDACVCNLDLVLRWLTIRFFDTNPSVILKAMDYLRNVFSLLSDDGYNISDYEAYAFLPTLILKLGDPKDAIRGPAKNILKIICNIYPANKIWTYVLEGLKSKNARQRAECLEMMGSLIEDFGASVCHPSPAQALKEVAKQIADRDTSVRNAALNCLLQVYYRDGEKLYKYIGHLSAKDQSLLDERIKRSAKNRPVLKKHVEPEPVPVRSNSGLMGRNKVIPTAAQPAPVLRDGSRGALNANHENTAMRRFGQRPLSADMSNMNSRMKFDYTQLENLCDDKPVLDINDRLEAIPDLHSILNDDVPAYEIKSNLSRPVYNSTMRSNMANANMNIEDASQVINMVITQVATPDVNTVITALSQLDEVIKCPDKRTQLMSHVDQLLLMATLQYRLVLTTKMGDDNLHKEDCVRIFRSLTNCLMNVFDNKELGTRAKKDVLHDVIHVVISILLDSRLEKLNDGNKIIRALNVLVVRIIEKAQFTQIFSALLKLLHDSIGDGTVNSNFTDLVMKCNWKLIRILPTKKKDLDPLVILQDAHHFMVEYPSNIWVNKPINTPFRTIKTVVHNLVLVYGPSIKIHLSKIPGTEGSEIEKYILKDLNNVESSGASVESEDSNRASSRNGTGEIDTATVTLNKSARRLSKTANKTLSEIFKKIGSKENTKEGLIELYEFKQMNPNADIDSSLRKSSTLFQNYIERGLKMVELERQGDLKSTGNSAASDSNNAPGPLSSIQVTEPSKSVNVNELVDQIKAIAAQAGFNNTYIDSAVKDIYSSDNKSENSNH